MYNCIKANSGNIAELKATHVILLVGRGSSALQLCCCLGENFESVTSRLTENTAEFEWQVSCYLLVREYIL